ncbi:MAG: mmcQ [Firmicutes bacterium]|nr:mmcQ [Bacillota bacterium]
MNDIVYMYVAAPFSAILYRCLVVEVDIPYNYESKQLTIHRVMKIKLLERYNKNLFTFQWLKRYGIKAVRGPRNMPEALSVAI